MSQPDGHECFSCRFWDSEGTQYDLETLTGSCHRNPPIFHTPLSHMRLTTDGGTGWMLGNWPNTYADGWCSEYQAESAETLENRPPCDEYEEDVPERAPSGALSGAPENPPADADGGGLNEES